MTRINNSTRFTHNGDIERWKERKEKNLCPHFYPSDLPVFQSVKQMKRFCISPNSAHSLFIFALLPFLLLGCLSMAAQNTVRVDGGMTEAYEMSESGTGSIQKWILPERRSINRIEIHFDPIEPLRNMTVYARMGEDNWRIVKAIKTPIRKSPYIIQAPLSTDAIRVVLGSSTGMIERIALYGTEAKAVSE